MLKNTGTMGSSHSLEALHSLILELVRKLYQKNDSKNDHTIRETKRKLRLGCLQGKKRLFLKVEELKQDHCNFSEIF